MNMFIARILPLALAGAVLAMPAPAAASARITIVNADGPNEGFNDPTPAAPVGGNPGTTKGQQRLIAFQFAADLWGAALDSNIDIQILAAFNPLGPNVLGAAASRFSDANFPTAPGFPGGNVNTNYHIALADKRAGLDLLVVETENEPNPADRLTPGEPEIVAQFSSDFDFYLGLDNNHGVQNDLVVVLLHELGHGLGFSSFMSRTTGATPNNFTDPYLNNTLDGSTNTPFSTIIATTPAGDRLPFIQKVDQIVWTGGNVAAAVPTTLRFGRPELDAPTLPAIDGSRYGTAAFGPPIPPNGITGTVVVANDGISAPATPGPPPTPAGTPTDGCEPFPPASAAVIAGKIALVDRGLCGFIVKVKNAQNAGAIAVLVADNAPDNPPAGLGGVDPTITISSARVLRATGDAIKAAGSPVTVTIGVNLARRAGTDLSDRPQLYATTPIIPGSTLNHWDPIAFRNLLMEPAINPDLTHNLIAPFDTTLAEMHDMGWFTDADLDGEEDETVILNGCDTRVDNDFIGNGALLADQARVWFAQCEASTASARAFENCVDGIAKQAQHDDILTGKQSSHLRQCAQTVGNARTGSN